RGRPLHPRPDILGRLPGWGAWAPRARLGGGPPGFLGSGEPLEQLLGHRERVDADVLEVEQERLVERVEVGDVLHAQRSREPVEAVERRVVQALGEALHEREPLVRADLQLAPAELEQEIDQHRGSGYALARFPTVSTSCSVLSKVPRNGIPPPTLPRSTPAFLSAQIQSISSLVDGRLRSRGVWRSP